MGNMGSRGGGAGRGPPGAPGKKPGDKGEAPKKKKFEVKPLTRIKKKKKKGPSAAAKLPKVYPTVKCKLREMKLERIKDFLLMEREFIQNQEVLRPKAERESAGELRTGGCGPVLLRGSRQIAPRSADVRHR